MEQEQSLRTLARRASRKLGRCILRLQQYELLMKKVMANSEISGYLDELESNQNKRKTAVASKTLGQLVGELTGSFLSSATEAPPQNVNDGDAELSPTRPHFKYRLEIEMAEKDYLRITKELSQLVTLRNELVHHFLERYNLWDESGCQDANTYLDEAYQTIDTHFRVLHGWASSLDQVNSTAVQFFESEAFQHYISYGVFPGADIDWPNTTIVQQLLAAESDHQVDGWTFLSNAIEIIRTRKPGLSPKKYGCGSWRHILHESRMFKIQKRKTDTNALEVWYRSLSSET